MERDGGVCLASSADAALSSRLLVCSRALPREPRLVGQRDEGGSLPRLREWRRARPGARGHSGWLGRQKFERLHERREQEIKGRFGKARRRDLSLKDDPQSTRAWQTGAAGEERLARFLERELPELAIVLHDRRIPGSRANIDHIVVAPSGIWVIDAKLYEGKVERRDVGSIWRSEPAVFVAGRNRTKLVRGMPPQVAAVREALATDPLASEIVIRPVVCFVASDWGLFAKPFEIAGVFVTWPQKLAERIALPGPLTETAVARLANRLAVSLPPAARS